MLTKYIKFSHRLNSIYPFIFYKEYDLSEKSLTKKGFLYGIGFKKNPFLFDIFKDKSGVDIIGWDIEYSLLILQNTTFKLNKHNLVYSRRSICSSKHTKITLEATGYKELAQLRNFWWSIAYEKIDDSNNVLTPQLEYDIKSFSLQKIPMILYFSGWYQFNSKQTDCYYSPNKTDSNILGLKIFKNFRYLKFKLKGGLGYSFFDKTYLYNYGAWLYSNNINNFEAKAGCDFSNSSTINKSTNYESMECGIWAKIIW